MDQLSAVRAVDYPIDASYVPSNYLHSQSRQAMMQYLSLILPLPFIDRDEGPLSPQSSTLICMLTSTLCTPVSEASSPEESEEVVRQLEGACSNDMQSQLRKELNPAPLSQTSEMTRKSSHNQQILGFGIKGPRCKKPLLEPTVIFEAWPGVSSCQNDNCAHASMVIWNLRKALLIRVFFTN